MFGKGRKRTRDEGAMGGPSKGLESKQLRDTNNALRKKKRVSALGLDSHLEEQRCVPNV